jgi:hypothetical protein
MQRLIGNEFLCNLTFERDAMRTVSGHGFYSSEARQRGVKSTNVKCPAEGAHSKRGLDLRAARPGAGRAQEAQPDAARLRPPARCPGRQTGAHLGQVRARLVGHCPWAKPLPASFCSPRAYRCANDHLVVIKIASGAHTSSELQCDFHPMNSMFRAPCAIVAKGLRRMQTLVFGTVPQTRPTHDRPETGGRTATGLASRRARFCSDQSPAAGKIRVIPKWNPVMTGRIQLETAEATPLGAAPGMLAGRTNRRAREKNAPVR